MKKMDKQSLGITWDELERELFTPEEIEETARQVDEYIARQNAKRAAADVEVAQKSA